ncbi:MAG TPA: protein kinase [Kribbellaceae bacterium]
MAFEDIEGYGVRRALGSGSAGSVWLARDLGSGRPVVVKRLPASLASSPEVFRRDLALAQGLDHAHVVRLLEIRQAEREWLLVSEYVAAGTLAELLERRGPLRTGELVTLLSPVAQALAAAHRTGLTHGHLGGGDVLLSADGRPMLADLGLRLTAADPERPATAADDLAALRRLALDAGGDPRIFTDALFAGDGTAVAERLLALAEPLPIALGFGDEARSDASADSEPSGAGERNAGSYSVGAQAPVSAHGNAVRSGAGSRRSPRRWRVRSRWARRAVVIGVLVVAAVATGTAGGLAIGTARRTTSSASGEPAVTTAAPATPVATPSATPDGADGAKTSARAWAAVLTALDVRRADAFARLDAGALDGVYVPGSAPWRADRALLASYEDRRLRVAGLRIRIQSVAVHRPGAGTVVLRVVDRFAGATAVDAAGRSFVLPAGPPTTRLITLRGQPGGWRISAIVVA